MKNYSLILAALFMGSWLHAQEKRPSGAPTPAGSVIVPQPTRSLDSRQHNSAFQSGGQLSSSVDTLEVTTVQDCDAAIANIDLEISAVENNPDKKKRAEANGWFDLMASRKAAYYHRRNTLVSTSGQ